MYSAHRRDFYAKLIGTLYITIFFRQRLGNNKVLVFYQVQRYSFT